jgi:DNA primase
MDNKHHDTKAIFAAMYSSFSNGIRGSVTKAPRDFLATLNLSHQKVDAVFNSGQYYHRKDDGFIAGLVHVGFLKKSTIPQNQNQKGYAQFGRYGVLFPLRDADGNITNFYAVQFTHQGRPTSYLNENGVYPSYPAPDTKTVMVCNNPIDTATLIESDVLDNKEAAVSLFDGKVMEQHLEILSAQALREVVLVGCDHQAESFIRERFPHLSVTAVSLPGDTSLNSVWVTGGREKLSRLLGQRDKPSQLHERETLTGLVRINAHKMVYRGETSDFFVQGDIGMDLSSLNVTLKIHFHTGQFIAGKYDLYLVSDRHAIAKDAQAFGVSPNDLEADLMVLVLYLDEYRDERMEAATSTKHKRMEPELSHARHMELMQFLSSPNLMENIDAKIAEAGVIGELGTRLTTFVIASSYQHRNPLHLILQGSSGSGKTHLLSCIASCIPEDRVLSLTKMSSMSLYYLNDEDVTDRLILIQDLDGLNDESLYALRELQSAKSITNYRPYRDRKSGDIRTEAKEVRGSFASLMATTRGEVYYDNLSRSIILGVSEDAAQTKRIIEYQNMKRAGIVDGNVEQDARALLRDMHHILKPYEVINPYAHRLSMPVDGMMLRRLNDQFLSFVEQITLLHQYQREFDGNGRLVTTVEDLRHAAELFFNAIFLKTDDLDSGLRQFYEQMKRHVREHIPTNKFRQRDIRHALRYSKSHAHRFFQDLKQREYIRVVGGTANKGFVYEIDYFDDSEKMKQAIKNDLLKQIEGLR